MKYTLITIGLLLVLSFIPMEVDIGYQHIDNVNEGISTFFLTSLDSGENIEVNITHTGSGNFTLFLFNERPIYSYVKIDKSLDKEIFTVAINYTVAETKLYYIQIILLDSGPDTFFLYCNRDLSRYYIPTIPGYQISIITVSIISALALLLIFYRNKMKRNEHF
jgi:branched-subunit amino acid ABC-type transport system permease component